MAVVVAAAAAVAAALLVAFVWLIVGMRWLDRMYAARVAARHRQQHRRRYPPTKPEDL